MKSKDSYNNSHRFKWSPFIPVILLLIAYCPDCYGLGMKIVRQYPYGLLADLMPWQIDMSGPWTYIATDEGLVQYDGLYPELFQFNNRRPVRSVSVDKDENRIYAGGISEFGYFIPSASASLEYVCLSDSVGEDRFIGNIWGIYPQKGNLILQGDHSILSYDLNTGQHSLINSDNKLDVSSMINGALWLGTDDGLKIMLGEGLVNAPNAGELIGKRIRGILPYEKGILIVTSDGIWTYANQHLRRETRYDDAVRDLGEIFSADLRGHTLALGSVGHGLGIVDLQSGDYEIYDEGNGLTSNTVITVKYDESGDLVAGMQFGMAKLLLQEPIENLDVTSKPIGSGFVMAHKGDKIYLGTNRGLYEVDYNPEVEKIGKKIERVSDLTGQVWGLNLIDGTLFCSLDHGLFTIGNSGNPERIGALTGVWDVKKMLGSQDKVYVGSYSGLHTLKLNKGQWEYESYIDGYPQSMYNFVQESGNVIWNDNAEEGIDRIVIDPTNHKVVEINNYKVTEDGFPLTADVYINRIDNSVYFSTKNGIYIYEPKSGEIIKEKEISGLLGNPKSVTRLKKANGSIFALSGNELLEADPAGILGMKRISLSPSVSVPIHEGDVFFPIGNDYLGYPIRNGFLLFDYSDKGDPLWKEEDPVVNINSLRVTTNGDSIAYRGNFGNIKNEPQLTYEENSLRIDFGSLEDLDKGVLYSTRLNNEDWSMPVRAISKELTDLKEGKYKFEVKAITPEGKESYDYVIFKISPPWWRSNWMWCIYAIFFIFLVIAIIRFEQLRINRRQQRLLHEKNQEIEAQKEMYLKETEAKDRHIEELEREQLQREVKHKAQEVANVMMTLTHKNDTLQLVKRELQNVLRVIPRSNTEARSIIANLQDKVVVDIKSDEVLKRVEEEFDIVHDNFMKRLREKYPDLSNNDILLCAYLKMNLTTKEIAPLMNISQRGVETMRYRLRKKLGLERDDSLSMFINNFGI